MRKAVSVSFEKRQLDVIDSILTNNKYRNRSHFIAIAIDKLIDDEVKSIRNNKSDFEDFC